MTGYVRCGDITLLAGTDNALNETVRCATLRYLTLVAALKACTQQQSWCGGVGRDSGLVCDPRFLHLPRRYWPFRSAIAARNGQLLRYELRSREISRLSTSNLPGHASWVRGDRCPMPRLEPRKIPQMLRLSKRQLVLFQQEATRGVPTPGPNASSPQFARCYSTLVFRAEQEATMHRQQRRDRQMFELWLARMQRFTMLPIYLMGGRCCSDCTQCARGHAMLHKLVASSPRHEQLHVVDVPLIEMPSGMLKQSTRHYRLCVADPRIRTSSTLAHLPSSGRSLSQFLSAVCTCSQNTKLHAWTLPCSELALLDYDTIPLRNPDAIFDACAQHPLCAAPDVNVNVRRFPFAIIYVARTRRTSTLCTTALSLPSSHKRPDLDPLHSHPPSLAAEYAENEESTHGW